MIKTFLKTAFRTLRRNKLFSLINILGLSVGLSAALVIYLIVQYDFSFEQFRRDKDRIYRVVTLSTFSSSAYPNSGLPYAVIPASRKEVRGIEESANFIQMPAGKTAIPRQNAAPLTFKYQQEMIYTDEHYFRTFSSYQWLAGSPATLNTPFQVALTESRAQTYFPGMSPAKIIGKTIIYDDTILCTVSGIVQEHEGNTDLTFQEFVSLPTFTHTGSAGLADPADWNSVSSANQFFVRLEKGAQPKQVEQQLATLRKKYSADAKDTSNTTTHFLQPFADIHFTSSYNAYTLPQANKSALYGLLVVAIFLLALGSINFINLTTAQAAQRAKEIGIRKTMGSSRRQLIFQFLSEAFLLTLISAILSIAIAPWLMKIFSDFIPKGLKLDLVHHPGIILFMAALIITITLLSGFYPAMVLSRFRPVLALKNQAYSGTSTTRNAWVRQTLTVFQFVIAQAFIIVTIIVGSQVHYFLNKDMGFKKDAIVFFNTPYGSPNLKTGTPLLMDKLHKIPGITELSLAGDAPASNSITSEKTTYIDGKKEVKTEVQYKVVDTAYMHLYGIKLLAGQNVTLSQPQSRQLVINRTYARMLGFDDPRQALGKTLNKDKYRIIGVMEDFHQTSLHKAIVPLALFYTEHIMDQSIHLSLVNTQAARTGWPSTLAAVEKAYKEIFPGETFEYTFFDASIAKFYTSEQHTSTLLRWATGLTIFISCLGLLGLVIYATNLRKKEIGIRKVLGASITQIVSLLSKDFVKLVCIGFAIAVPIAWYAAHRWMENFAYRTTISGWVYVLSGLIMVLMALLTLGIQTIRAASANPVKSLKTE